MNLNGSIKTALIYGAVTLGAAFIGVWGGREVVLSELRTLQEANRANAEAISKNIVAVTLLTIQVEKLSVGAAGQLEELKSIKQDIKELQQWRIEISDLASKRGIEIPELKRRIEILEGRHK